MKKPWLKRAGIAILLVVVTVCGGAFAGIEATPDGQLLTASEWEGQRDRYLPSALDKTHVHSLIRPVHERGKIASWIAPPRNGINNQPFDYDYVHLP